MWDLFFQAAWKVALAGLVLGAGLPAVFATGVRFWEAGADTVEGAPARSRTTYRVAGAACFGVATVAVALGLTMIVAAGFGMTLSFAHVYPTLTPKG